MTTTNETIDRLTQAIDATSASIVAGAESQVAHVRAYGASLVNAAREVVVGVQREQATLTELTEAVEAKQRDLAQVEAKCRELAARIDVTKAQVDMVLAKAGLPAATSEPAR